MATDSPAPALAPPKARRERFLVRADDLVIVPPGEDEPTEPDETRPTPAAGELR